MVIKSIDNINKPRETYINNLYSLELVSRLLTYAIIALPRYLRFILFDTMKKML